MLASHLAYGNCRQARPRVIVGDDLELVQCPALIGWCLDYWQGVQPKETRRVFQHR